MLSTTTLTTLAFLLPAFSNALSNNDIASVFGAGATGLTGSSVSLPTFVLSVVTNQTHALVSLNQTTNPVSQVGWMASAVGTAMANADFLVTWPATTGTAVEWTLSHRTSTGEFQPVLASTVAATSTNVFYTLVPSLSTNSTNSPFTVVSYLRHLAAPANYVTTSAFGSISRAPTGFIYASSTIKPNDPAVGASLTQHNQAHTTTSLDLSTALSIAPAGTNSTSPSGVGISTTTQTGRTRRDMLLVAHASIVSLAFLVVIPSAILIARFFRHSKWFVWHASINSLAAVMVIVGTAIAFTQYRAPLGTNQHAVIGSLVLALVLVQVLLGIFAHRRPLAPLTSSSTPIRFPTLSLSKSPFRLVHILLGIVITALGFTNVRLGIRQWPISSDAATPVPTAVTGVYWALVALWIVAYLAGWVKEGVSKSLPVGGKSPVSVESNESREDSGQLVEANKVET